MEDVHSSWLSNYSYKKYDWNSFPDLLNISGPRRTGLLTLDNAYVDIWAPSVWKFSIFSKKFCFIRYYRRGEAVYPPPPSSTKKVTHLKKLCFNAFGRNKNNFQHFIIYHLGPLITAYKNAPNGKSFLVDLNERSLEIALAAGIPMKSLIAVVSGVRYCADDYRCHCCRSLVGFSALKFDFFNLVNTFMYALRDSSSIFRAKYPQKTFFSRRRPVGFVGNYKVKKLKAGQGVSTTRTLR